MKRTAILLCPCCGGEMLLWTEDDRQAYRRGRLTGVYEFPLSYDDGSPIPVEVIAINGDAVPVYLG